MAVIRAGSGRKLLQRAANIREHVVGVRTDQPNCTHDDNQNHCQHHRVFRDVLTALIVPEFCESFPNCCKSLAIVSSLSIS